MEIALAIVVISIAFLYLNWINSSIREMKNKLSHIEELLKGKENE